MGLGALLCYVSDKSKLKHPLPATNGAFEFLENFVQIPHSRGQKAVQMPHHRSIPGDQMPPSPGNFSVASVTITRGLQPPKKANATALLQTSLFLDIFPAK